MIGEKIVEDSKRSRFEKLRQGKITNPTPKYGHIYIDKRQKDGRRFEIVPEKAKMVRQIFRRHVRDSLSIYAIAKTLNQAGIPSPGRNGALGGLWSRTVVWEIVRRAVYVSVPNGIAISGSDLFVVNTGSGTIGEYTTSGTVVGNAR